MTNAGPGGICIGCPCDKWHGSLLKLTDADDADPGELQAALCKISGERDALARESDKMIQALFNVTSELAVANAEVGRLRCMLEEIVDAHSVSMTCTWAPERQAARDRMDRAVVAARDMLNKES